MSQNRYPRNDERRGRNDRRDNRYYDNRGGSRYDQSENRYNDRRDNQSYGNQGWKRSYNSENQEGGNRNNYSSSGRDYKHRKQNDEIEQNFYHVKGKDLDSVILSEFYQTPLSVPQDALNKVTNPKNISLSEYISNYHKYNLYSQLFGKSIIKDGDTTKFLVIIPRIEMEIMRAVQLQGLRNLQRDLLEEKLEMRQVPKQSFNRWLLERKVLENKQFRNDFSNVGCVDPLLPALFPTSSGGYIIDPNSESLRREILDDIPVKVSMFPKCANDAIQSFETYLKACKELSQRDDLGRSLSEEEKEVILTECNTNLSWGAMEIKSNRRDKEREDNIMNRLKELKVSIGSKLQEKVRGSTDEICQAISKKSDEIVNGILKSSISAIVEKESTPKVEQSKTLCDFLINYYDHERLDKLTKLVEKVENRSQITLNVNSSLLEKDLNVGNISTSCYLNVSHYEKLKRHLIHRLYIIAGSDKTSRDTLEKIFTSTFNRSSLLDYFIYCLLLRYSAMFGISERRFEGAGLHAACPVEVFDLFNREMHVHSENFASPLNCYFADFCSAFSDTDFWFGSLGSFFEFFPQSGTFESNPPFSEELMQVMVLHMESLISESNQRNEQNNATDTLTFMIVVPNWMDAESLQWLCKSPHLTFETVLGANEHSYINGFQHSEPVHKRKYSAVHETHFFVLQNKQAAQQPITTDFVKQFKASFQVKPSHR